MLGPPRVVFRSFRELASFFGELVYVQPLSHQLSATVDLWLLLLVLTILLPLPLLHLSFFQEVCAFLGEARTGTVSVTRSGDRDLRRGALSSAALLSGGRNGKGGIGGGIGGVRRDIDRIFESSVAGSGEIFCPVFGLAFA